MKWTKTTTAHPNTTRPFYMQNFTFMSSYELIGIKKHRFLFWTQKEGQKTDHCAYDRNNTYSCLFKFGTPEEPPHSYIGIIQIVFFKISEQWYNNEENKKKKEKTTKEKRVENSVNYVWIQNSDLFGSRTA